MGTVKAIAQSALVAVVVIAIVTRVPKLRKFVTGIE